MWHIETVRSGDGAVCVRRRVFGSAFFSAFRQLKIRVLSLSLRHVHKTGKIRTRKRNKRRDEKRGEKCGNNIKDRTKVTLGHGIHKSNISKMYCQFLISDFYVKIKLVSVFHEHGPHSI